MSCETMSQLRSKFSQLHTFITKSGRATNDTKIDQRHLRWQPFVKADITLKEWTLSSTLWLHVWKWDGEPELHRNNSTHSQRPKERILSYNSPAYMQSYYTRVYIYVLIPQSTILKTASQKIQHRSCHILFTCILLLMSKKLNKFMLNSWGQASFNFSCWLLDGIIDFIEKISLSRYLLSQAMNTLRVASTQLLQTGHLNTDIRSRNSWVLEGSYSCWYLETLLGVFCKASPEQH